MVETREGVGYFRLNVSCCANCYNMGWGERGRYYCDVLEEYVDGDGKCNKWEVI